MARSIGGAPLRGSSRALGLATVLALGATAAAQRARGLTGGNAGATQVRCAGTLGEIFPDRQLLTNSSQGSLAIADLDGDGDRDLALAYVSNTTVSIFLNEGSGAFAARVDYPAAKANDLATLDVENDGDLDLALASTSIDRVTLLQNQGDGTFTTLGQLVVGDAPNDVVAVDLGTDGRTDLVTVDYQGNTLSVLRNLGGGSFASAIPVAVSSDPISVASLDYDHDGLQDLAVACSGADVIQVLRNLGGSFAAPVTLPSFSSPLQVVAADTDGDSFAELVATSFESLPFTGTVLSVYPNLGGSGFGPASEMFVSQPGGMASLDYDLDGDLDLALTWTGPPANPGLEGWRPSVSLYENDGSGSFSFDHRRLVSEGAGFVAAGDLDGDGRSDLAVVNNGARAVSILRNQAGSFVGAPTFGTGGYTIDSVTSADLDGDGDRDLASTSNFQGTSSVDVLCNQGGGALGNLASYGVTAAAGIESADLDGDGAIDLVFASDNALQPFVNQGNGTFAPGAQLALPGTGRSIAPSDLDGDGDVDLAAANEFIDGVSVLLNLGNGSFAPQVSHAVGVAPRSLASADLDLDGDRDLVAANLGSGTLTRLRNLGDGTFATGVTLPFVAPAPFRVVCADLDLDHDQDIGAVSSTGSSLSLLENLGGNSFQNPTTVFFDGSTGGAALLAADLDRDGFRDFAIARSTYNAVTLLRGDGTFDPLSSTRHATGPYPVDLLAGDFDGDGDAELVTADYWATQVSVITNRCR